MIQGVGGAVLAGGLSRRFGSDKARAPWAGRTLVETVAGTLTELFGETLLVVKDPSAFRFVSGPGLRAEKDLYGDQHPLGGLATALARAKSPRVFVCACDMPFLSPELVARLCALDPDAPAVAPLWDGRPQPLCAVYSPSKCLEEARRLISKGRLELRGLLSEVDARLVPQEEVRALDAAGMSFRDLDTAGDYERALKELAC